MDPKGRDEMLELVRDLGHNKDVSLILSSHLLPDVEYTCEHVIVMDKGQVAAQGPIEELKGPAAASSSCASRATWRRSSRCCARPGMECHATDEDVMRVFVPWGSDRVDQRSAGDLRAGGAARRPGAAPAPQHSDARRCLRQGARRAMIAPPDETHADSRSELSPVRRAAQRRSAAAWLVIAVAGIRTMIRKRAFLGLLLMSWMPFLGRAVADLVRRERAADGAAPGAERRDLPRFPRQAGLFRVLRHHLRRRRADRQRPARQRPADLPVEAAAADRVHRREGGGAVRVPVCWSPGCRRSCCC